MAVPRHLSSPPIREALVDIRIAETPDIDARKLEPLKGQLAGEYPKIEERHQMQARIDLNPKNTVAETIDLGFLGLFMSSEERKAIVQFRQNGFTYNKLAPYTTAEDLFRESLRLWSLYTAVVQPRAVIRVALRYINSMSLPMSQGDDFSRFLTAAPIVPVELPQKMSDFVTRITLIDTERELTAIISQKLTQGAPGAVPVVLDIDVFRLFRQGQMPMAAEDLEPLLQQMRELKNRALFSHLTEEAIRLFE